MSWWSKLKERMSKPEFWMFQAVIFGFVLGIPFIVSIRSYSDFITKMAVWQMALVIVVTFIMGFFAEGYLRRAKILE